MNLRDITLGRYIHGASFMHRLDPRTKLLSLLLISTTLFSTDSWTTVGIAAAVTVTAMFSSALSAGAYFRGLLPFKWLIIMTFALNVLFRGGDIIFTAPLPYGGVSREGLELGLLLSSKIAMLVLLASVMTLTTEPIILVDGIEKLISPLARLGLHVHEVATAMVITIRFIPILIDEAEKIQKSYAARGFRADTIAARMRGISMMFLPLFYSAMRRAETLAVAMDCRMYHCAEKRTRLVNIAMTSRDWLTLGLTTLLAAAMFTR